VQWKTYNALQDLTDLAGKRRVIAVQIGDTSSSETT
jgi:hypothetical protein